MSAGRSRRKDLSVNEVGRCLAAQGGEEILRRQLDHPQPGLPRRASQVRSEDDVRQAGQAGMDFRFSLEDVKP
ncbi:MAG: hypothetical protein ACRD88_06405, partial [Terriglobia bacterium]